MRLCIVLAAFFALGLSLGHRIASAQGAPESCVKSECRTNYVAYGYNHTVHLENTCSTAMRCSVASDANPQPQQAQLAVGASTDVRTFTGSPASACRAIVSCSPAR